MSLPFNRIAGVTVALAIALPLLTAPALADKKIYTSNTLVKLYNKVTSHCAELRLDYGQTMADAAAVDDLDMKSSLIDQARGIRDQAAGEGCGWAA